MVALNEGFNGPRVTGRSVADESLLDEMSPDELSVYKTLNPFQPIFLSVKVNPRCTGSNLCGFPCMYKGK